MRKIKPSNEDEMIYEFLKMELDSDRYKEKIEAILNEMKIEKNIIINGNIMSEQENILRIEILKRFRGWRNEELFENFPSKVEWIWTEFGKEDMAKIFYIKYSYWNELSNYTGSPIEAAREILSGKTVFDMPTTDFIKIAQKLKEGNIFAPMIFLTDKSESRYIILEGHVRMTAYSLAPEYFENISVLLGYCDREELNQWHGEMPERH
jgi:hypothetical protein